ncbi:hypothetical protein [Parabacteroides sp. Marseille-P3160]|uniref:hypothetical protein n=1 Tax=Parabacteroides sp. Marseille-P3160 TaxID=1917887 RepID=UPI00190E60A5|nr:hypothetical protein [Parabacteroides sp. Marseille-P3160]
MEKDYGFRNLVREMRKYQKEYFKSRDKNILSTTKRLERDVDEELRDNKQTNYFETEQF